MKARFWGRFLDTFYRFWVNLRVLWESFWDLISTLIFGQFFCIFSCVFDHPRIHKPGLAAKRKAHWNHSALDCAVLLCSGLWSVCLTGLCSGLWSSLWSLVWSLVWSGLVLSICLSVCVSVCLFVWLFVCLFPNSSETANPSELKFWGMIPLGIGKVLG